jgi:hypothetical protein
MSTTKLQFPSGPWSGLFESAMSLLGQVASQGIRVPQWSMGGGTVLMFYYQHRQSKDVDIFLSDPQFLAYLNPRLGGPAESLTMEYKESANFIKLYLDDGEIDFVVSSPLTANPGVLHEVLGYSILLETPVEIVAKKIWHRGDIATARDLFDLAFVIEHEADKLRLYPHLFQKHSKVFIEQCHFRQKFLMPQFEQIDMIGTQKSYLECLEIVENFFMTLPP